MSRNNFNAKVTYANKELTMKERVALQTLAGAIGLDEATQAGPIDITPVLWAAVDVHNDGSKGEKDYRKFVIIDQDNQCYSTGSESFWDAFTDIADQMSGSGEEWGVRVYRRPSKNYQGRDFLTCSVI